jgi:hypothetical protein
MLAPTIATVEMFLEALSSITESAVGIAFLAEE